ncbi:hypothetical protein C8J56DRAFT_899125 [Mycena floridula]|nr:hypothetical protein C8J56DRAFT_899125 [Mycena floridula]
MAPSSAKQKELEDLLQSLDDLKHGRARQQQAKKKCPNKHTSRLASNKPEDSERKWKPISGDINYPNQWIVISTRELMQLEGQLITHAVECLHYGSFEVGWKKMDKERKEEIVLEGLYRGACAAPRNNSHISCPEMTIKGLLGDSEYNLTNLLKRLIEHDPTGNHRAKEVYLFVHPYVEHEYRITEAAPDILRAFIHQHGRPPVAIQVARFGGQEYKGEERQKARDKLKNSNIQIDQSQCKEEAKAVVNECLAISSHRKSFKRCGRCKSVRYCSVECQTKNWKEHKKVCSQQDFDPELLSPSPQAPDQFISCPDSVPGFIRTPALWRQIWCLSKADSQNRNHHRDNWHYRSTWNMDAPGPLQSLMLSDRGLCELADRSWFHVARRHAMASGDISVGHMMLHIIEAQDNDHHYGLGVDKIRHQFELEYNISFSADKLVNNVCEMATGEEVFEEIEFLRKRLATVNIKDRYTTHCLALGSDFVRSLHNSL